MLEAVLLQKRAARWIYSKWNPNTFTWSKTTEACLQELHWPSLVSMHSYLCIAFLFDLLRTSDIKLQPRIMNLLKELVRIRTDIK